jgi:hypothetical protein
VSAIPPVVRYILGSAVVGALIGILLAAALIATNAAGIGALIRDSSDPLSPLLLIALGFSTLFGSLYAGSAIMLLPDDKYDPAARRFDDTKCD